MNTSKNYLGKVLCLTDVHIEVAQLVNEINRALSFAVKLHSVSINKDELQNGAEMERLWEGFHLFFVICNYPVSSGNSLNERI